MSKNTRAFRLEDISLLCLGRMLLRNLWMVVATAVIFAMGASLGLSWLRQPVYQASMTYAVSSRKTSYSTSSSLSASKEVAAVLTELLETDLILENIREYSTELSAFDGTISAAQVDETNLINVTSQASTPEQAFRSLQALADLFPELSDYISDSSVVQLIRNPSVSATPVNQVDRQDTAVKAGALGAVLMAAVLCWISISRETVQTRAGARHLLDAPVVAVIGHERKKRTLRSRLRGKKTGLQVFSPTTSYAYSEQINAVCSRLEQENVAKGHKIFLITGVGENEGKSTVAGNVAAMMAQKGKNVALMDADLRKPAMNRFFDGAYKAALPLNQMLAKPFSRANFLDCMVRHSRLGMYMLFPAGADKRSGELLTGETMKNVLKQLRVFDYVIVDSPPMGFFADTEALAEQVDATILVVRQDSTPACDINDAADTLRNSSSTFLGVVLNDMTGRSAGGYGYSYGYGYGAAGRKTSGQTSRKRDS